MKEYFKFLHVLSSSNSSCNLIEKRNWLKEIAFNEEMNELLWNDGIDFIREIIGC